MCVLRTQNISIYKSKSGTRIPKDINVVIDLEIKEYGEYSFSMVFGEDKINGLIKVEEFK